MNYFFGFETKLGAETDWFFNANHLFLLLWVAGFVTACCFLFSAKTEKGKKITKLVLAAVLFILEVGRIVYKYLLHRSHGGTALDFNWWWTISFQMCAIMTWTTIVTLVLSAFLPKEKKILNYLYNILFGCALLGGALTFCYPDCMSSDRPFLHFLNIQTVTVHALLIFVPIYLIKTQEFKVEIKNIWKLFVGFVLVGGLSMSASIISGENFAFAKEFDLFDLGLPFPWHLPVVMIILVAVSTLIYGVFELVRKLKNKKQQKEENKSVKQGKALYITTIASAIVFGMLIILGCAALIGSTTPTWLGIVCLLGLAYTIIWIVIAEHNYQAANQSNNLTKTQSIIKIVLAILFNLPVGVVSLVNYLKEGNIYGYNKG